jgi:hypothetical protein
MRNVIERPEFARIPGAKNNLLIKKITGEKAMKNIRKTANVE